MGVIQIRVDDKLKADANKVFEDVGVDMSTAIRMFLKRCVIAKWLPFNKDPLTEDDIYYWQYEGRELKEQDKNPNMNMSLDEINEEIRLAREERKKRNQ